MNSQNTEAVVARQVTIPICSNGLELYKFLRVNPQYETVILCYPLTEIPTRILITPDTKPIVIPKHSNQSRFLEYSILIVKNESIYDFFEYPSTSIN